MRILICFLFIVILAAEKTSTTTEDDGSIKAVIDKACGGAPYKDTCLQSLTASGTSDGTDLGGLLCVAVNQVYVNLTAAQDYAKKLHPTMKAGFSKECVYDCTNSYLDAISFTEAAATACEKKSYENLKNNLMSAMADPQNCEEYFTLVPGNASPLKDRNDILLQLYANAVAIVDLLTGVTGTGQH